MEETQTTHKRRRLDRPSGLLRSPAARGLASGVSQIDRTGGYDGAGIIRGISVITTGEALGHDMWIDQQCLQQVASAINANPLGTKSRFTHPGLSGDGLGKFLGRVQNASVDGNVVRADQHFAKSAHTTPDGDLAGYAMDLAAGDPAAYGASIAFEHDEDAEDAFAAQFGGPGKFKSPDLANAKNLPHVRLKELRAVDMVDSPAANPNGLFHRDDDPAAEADRVAEYCLGLVDECPQANLFGVHPDRARSFIQQFLHSSGLAIVHNATGKPLEMNNAISGLMDSASAYAERRERERDSYVQHFGPKGGTWFDRGLTRDEARELFRQQHSAESRDSYKMRMQHLSGGIGEQFAKMGDVRQAREDRKPKPGPKSNAGLGGDGLMRFAKGIKMPS